MSYPHLPHMQGVPHLGALPAPPYPVGPYPAPYPYPASHLHAGFGVPAGPVSMAGSPLPVPSPSTAHDMRLITDLQQLLHAIKHTPGTRSLVCNLGGATIKWPENASAPHPSSINILRPGLTISNGTLQLPPDTRIHVAAQRVSFQDVTIKGSGSRPGNAEAPTGLVTVLTQASLAMTECMIELSEDSGSHVTGMVVSCTQTGCMSAAQLVRCTFSGCSGDGVCASGPGSYVSAHLCASRWVSEYACCSFVRVVR